MKKRHRGQRLPERLTQLLILTSLGCADARLRELGYTLGSSEPSPTDFIEPDPPRCDAELISLDGVNGAVRDDLSARPAVDRPFLRYVSLANRLNAGACPQDLDRDRGALSKLVNGLSRQPEIVVPTAVDADGTLLRIDIRDYGWARAVDVQGEAFADGWEAVISSTPFAVELEGPAASFVKSEARTSVPLLSLDAFLAAASAPALYYALLGMPGTLGELRQSVGLPSALDPLADAALRGATQRSRVLRTNGGVRVIDRYAIDSGSQGSYYEALQVNVGSFLADPLHLQPDVQRLIFFSLPNDLLAFAVMDASGARTGVAELVLDTNRNDFTATVVTSCANCHALGPITFFDEIRDVVLDNPDGFPDEVVSAYQSSPTHEQRAEIFDADSNLYARALERAGHPAQGADGIAFRTLAFEYDVTREAAASELLVEPEVLTARLADAVPALRALGLGLSLSREQFGTVYASALCTLHAGSENRPVASACQAAP